MGGGEAFGSFGITYGLGGSPGGGGGGSSTGSCLGAGFISRIEHARSLI
jgi:hypothetical protein